MFRGDRSARPCSGAQPGSRHSEVCQRPHGCSLQVLLQGQAHSDRAPCVTAHAMAAGQGRGGAQRMGLQVP